MWQKCPICQGTGINNNSSWREPCSVCKGQKIISELTGKPPATSVNTSNTTTDLGNIDVENEKAIVKFNNGRGAILCSKCRVIIKTFKDLSKEEHKNLQLGELKAQYCENCKKE